MQKAKELLKNKKNLYILGGGVVIILAAIIVIVVVKANGNNEQELEKSLKALGQDFYENYYYDQIGKTEKEKTEILAKYSKIGIKINLDNLGRYNSNANEDEIAKFVNSETNEKCDTKNTKVFIYPKESYGKKDYDIKVELICGFENKK